jgi:hypothetical protein
MYSTTQLATDLANGPRGGGRVLVGEAVATSAGTVGGDTHAYFGIDVADSAETLTPENLAALLGPLEREHPVMCTASGGGPVYAASGEYVGDDFVITTV